MTTVLVPSKFTESTVVTRGAWLKASPQSSVSKPMDTPSEASVVETPVTFAVTVFGWVTVAVHWVAATQSTSESQIVNSVDVADGSGELGALSSYTPCTSMDAALKLATPATAFVAPPPDNCAPEPGCGDPGSIASAIATVAVETRWLAPPRPSLSTHPPVLLAIHSPTP